MLDLNSPQYWTPRKGCPRLFLAPMEGLNDRPWRKAYARIIGGFDEACTEFIRMPTTGHAKSLAKAYNPNEIDPIPLAAQIMADDVEACAALCYEIAARGAGRIDLNCGCPSNTVVGKGAGSSLLKTPHRIYDMVTAMRRCCDVPISVKMRAGYDDDLLFKENLEAIESAGASFITLHPRTRAQGYTGHARWELVAKAKQLSRLPIVASGDITDIDKAKALVSLSQCDGLMIGRGAFIDPWIFWRLRTHFTKNSTEAAFHLTLDQELDQLKQLLDHFLTHIPEMSPKGQTGRLKQVIRFLLQRHPTLQHNLKPLLLQNNRPEEMIELLIALWREHAADLSPTS